MKDKITVGDICHTPRFGDVRIAEVFLTKKIANIMGYTEPTYYKNPYYGILGKSIGDNQMTFAGYKKAVEKVNVLNMSISYLDLSVRTYNALIKGGIETIGDLICLDEEKLIFLAGIGQNAIKEIMTRLEDKGLSLNMQKPKKRIFVINGSGGTGKDTFVRFVSDTRESMSSNLPEFIQLPPKVVNFSYVECIKNLASQMGWNGGKTDKDRKFLADMLELCAEYNDYPFKIMEQAIDRFLDSWSEFMFLHIRTPKEIKRVVENYGATTILVTRKGVERITTNSADKSVFDYDYDYVIKNDGTLEDLQSQAYDFAYVNDPAIEF